MIEAVAQAVATRNVRDFEGLGPGRLQGLITPAHAFYHPAMAASGTYSESGGPIAQWEAHPGTPRYQQGTSGHGDVRAQATNRPAQGS